MIYLSPRARQSVTALTVSLGLAAMPCGWRAIEGCCGARQRAQRCRIPSWIMHDYRLHDLDLIPVDIYYLRLSRSFWRDV